MAVATYFNAANLARDGLLETFDPADFPAMKNVPESYQMKGKDGRLIGIPAYFQYYGIAVNTDLAKVSDFQSWNDLANPKWKGKLAVTRPIYGSTYDLVIFAKINGGDENNIEPGLPLLKALAGNSLTVYNSMAHLNTLLTRGEVAAAPYYVTRVWGMKKAGVKNVEFVLPKEGSLAIPYILVVPKGAKNPAAYKAFLNFALEPPQQAKMLDLSGYIPLNTATPISPEHEKNFGMKLPDLLKRLYQPDWDVIARTHKERVAQVEQLLSR
jgi:putative spermidine/putrescine transport system substrate-binding protein